MNHQAVAVKIEQEIRRGVSPAVAVKGCARQGDVLLRRVGEVDSRRQHMAPFGACVGAGNHGEHWLLAEEGSVVEGVYHLPQGGVLTHTDVPSARHGALLLAPGAWEFIREQELGLDAVVRPVQD